MKSYKNTERTKKWIRDAFIEMLSEKKAINKVSVNELVLRADITKTTFYYHYQDVYAVAEEIEQEIINELSSIFDSLEQNTSDIDSYIARIISFVKEKENGYKLVINCVDINLFIYKVKQIIMKRLDIPNLGFSHNDNLKAIQITFFTSGSIDLLVEYFKGNLDCSLEQIEVMIKTIIRKLQAN